MKKSLKISSGLLIVGLIAYGYGEWSRQNLRSSVAKVRRELRQQHFRTDLSDFNFTLLTEARTRADLVISAGQAVRSMTPAYEVKLLERLATNVARPTLLVETIERSQETNRWLAIKGEFEKHNSALDGACAALIAGPIKFQPTVKTSGDILLPYLADVKNLARALATRAVLAMREHNGNGMFTNVLALSRLVTAWNPEPMEIAHLVRFACQEIAGQTIWKSLQTDLWNEAQLAALQREWESAGLFGGLPETAELSCANMVRLCQAARKETYSSKIGGWGTVLGSFFSSPASACPGLWAAIQGYRQHVSYQNQGSYEDEKALLRYHRERHQELNRSTACSTWAAMCFLPGTTNMVAFKGANRSRIATIMNLKQLSLRFQGQGRTLLSKAAEAEAHRRLIVTALALQRFALQHKTYPNSLTELVPALLPDVPMDFMDGKALRYRRLNDGRFALYSVGLDCVDNGGQMGAAANLLPNRARSGTRLSLSSRIDSDIVWPLPAMQADVDAFQQTEK